jgi:aminopeptidase N
MKRVSEIYRSVCVCICLMASLCHPGDALARINGPARTQSGMGGDPPPSSDRLVHTRLALSFDYARRLVKGKAWITIDPQAPISDSLVLDARCMEFLRVQMCLPDKAVTLPYTQKGRKIHIGLDRPKVRGEKYTVYLEYVAGPGRQENAGAAREQSSGVQESRGIYFVRAGEDASGPLYQVWTQGETTGSSAWFPTIDMPDQRSTAEIGLTVPAKYESLSNGVLSKRQTHANGTRTDTWIMDSPHAPYLFMLAIGKFTICHDRWNNIPVDYYMEPSYSSQARSIFHNTPQMMDFFSEKLGYRFPWPKYAQIVVKDYFSGGMENTTATLFGSLLRRKPRSFIGDVEAKWVIPHELFHQWFGDLVTCNSWSRLALNESLASFGEILWGEYAYGRDVADDHAYEDMLKYLEQSKEGPDHPLIYSAYDHEASLFDAITYEKGACILNMLRDLVGEETFFRSLRTYLSDNAFGRVTETDLRKSFEKASGLDLAWFWDQWFYQKGYPVLDISYLYDDEKAIVTVQIDQRQGGLVYRMPLQIDVYGGNRPERHSIVADQRSQAFSLPYPDGHTRPLLINVDAGKKLLCRKTDHKPLEASLLQYRYAPGYYNRREALMACLLAQDTSDAARLFLRTGLQDSCAALRKWVADNINLGNTVTRSCYEPVMDSLARHDQDPLVRQAAVKKLRSLNDKKYIPLLILSLQDSSYDVVASSLIGLNRLDKALAAPYVRGFAGDDDMSSTLLKIFISNRDTNDNNTFLRIIERQDARFKQAYLEKYLNYLAALEDTSVIADGLKQFRLIVADIDPQFLDRAEIEQSLEMLPPQFRQSPFITYLTVIKTDLWH